MDYQRWVTGELPKDLRLGLRVGQSYLNHLHPNVVYPELFYEKDDKKAWDMIHNVEAGEVVECSVNLYTKRCNR